MFFRYSCYGSYSDIVKIFIRLKEMCFLLYFQKIPLIFLDKSWVNGVVSLPHTENEQDKWVQYYNKIHLGQMIF